MFHFKWSIGRKLVTKINSGSRMKMLLIFVMSNIIAMAFSDIFWKLFLIDFIISM